MIDDRWIAVKPKWEQYRHHPISVAYAWRRPLAVFDAHLHVIDPRFPLVANQGYVPTPSPPTTTAPPPPA